MFTNGFNLGMIMGDKNKFGDPDATDDWVDIESNWINYTIRPNNEETFNLRIMPVNQESIEDMIYIQCNVEEGNIQIPVSAEFVQPPVISADQTKISVRANTIDEEQHRQFTFKNEGASNLEYSLGIGFDDPYSESFNVYSLQEYNFFTSSAEKPSIMKFENEGPVISTFSNDFERDEFNNILEHEDTEVSENALGFNGSLPLSTATSFAAPAEGFNLSHVVLWYNYGEVLSSEIEVEIRGGHNNFFNTEVLHTYTYTHKADEATDYGNFITIDLEEQLFFYPKEKFYVVLHFEQKVLYPQGISVVPSPQLDRFYYGDGSFFIDAVNAGFGSLAWMVKAVEVEPSDNFWVMIDSEKEGSLAPGEETTVDLTFASIFALQGTNDALVQISSNDPLDSLVSVPVELYQNMGPAYPDGDAAYFSVYEMDTMLYRLRPYDPDGDEFTVKVVEDKPYFEYTQEGNDINFYFTPDYDGEGDHFIEVEGEDEYGNTSKFTLNISVMNLNRAPVVHQEIGEQVFPLESDEGIYMDLTDYISDPDEDPLTFEVFYSATDVLTHMQDGSAVVFTPRKLGDIEINIKATDIHGASVDTEFMAFVDHRVGVDDNEAVRVAIYPNPVSDVLRIYSNATNSQESLVQIYTITGEEILRREFILNNESALDLKHLTEGIYLLKLTQGEKVITKKITKI